MSGYRPLALACGLLFGALLLVLPPAKFALALVIAVLALSLFRRPSLSLALFAMSATCIPYTTLQLGVRITVSEALLALAWLGTLWQLAVHRLHWRWGSTEKALALLMVFSALPFVVGEFAIHADGNGLVSWMRWLLNLSVLFMVPLLVTDEAQRERLIVLLLIGNLAMLLFSLGVFLQHRDAEDMIPWLSLLRYAHPESVQDIFSADTSRLATPWVHPNLSGGALALFVPLGLLYALVRRGPKRWLGGTVALLGSAALLLSSSRGAILSLGLVLLWMGWLRVPSIRKIIVGVIVLSVVVVVFYPPLQARLATMFSASNASTEIRFDEYRHFPEAMLRYPLGIGFKTDPPVPDSGLLGISNLWLNYIYKLGIPGMLLFCAVLARWWRECRPLEPARQVDDTHALWLGSLGGVTAALLTGLFDHYYSFTVVLVSLFWLMLGLNLQAARALPDVGRKPLSWLAPPLSGARA